MPYKKIALSILAVIILITGICVGLFLKSSDLADQAFRKYLKNYGIESTSIPEPQKRIGALRYNNILLSAEGETSIDTLTIEYEPLRWNNPKSIRIDGLFLSGELDINGDLSIKGLPELTKITSHPQNIGKLSINEINFSILSAHFGGIRGTSNITAHKQNNALVWSGNIDSRQDQMELIAKLNGQINESGSWFIDFEIENAKLEREWGKFTRAHGSASWNGQGENWEKLTTELNAGGLIIQDTPWRNAAITLELTPKKTKTNMAAKSAGRENIELSIDTTYIDKNLRWRGSIFSPTFEELINYLDTNKILPVEPKMLAKIKGTQNVLIRVTSKSDGLIFNMNSDLKDTHAKGEITKTSANEVNLNFRAPRTFLNRTGVPQCRTAINRRPICNLNLKYEDGTYTIKEF